MSATNDKALHPHERVVLQKRRLMWVLGGLSFVCVIGAILAFWLWNWRQSHRVAVILKAVAARGEPTSGEELNAYFRVPDHEQDATQLWLAGLEPLTKPHTNEEGVTLPFVEGEEAATQVGTELTAIQKVAARKHLARFSTSFEIFHAAAAKGGRARLPVDFRDGIGTILKYEQAARFAARLLLLDISEKVSRGDERGSAKSLLTLLLLSRCLEQEPCAVSQNLCSAIERMGVEAMATLLFRIEFTPDELAAFEKIIASRNEHRRMREALVGERVMGLETFENPADWRQFEGHRYVPISKADLALYLEHIDRVAAAVELEFPACMAAAQRAQNRLDVNSSQGLATLTSQMTKSLTPDFKKNFVLHTAYAAAANRAGLAAIAVEKFRRQTNTIPQALSDLVPAYLPAEPLDPFTGNAMIYRTTPSGIWIYSVGENLVDDQGADLSGLDRGVRIPAKVN